VLLFVGNILASKSRESRLHVFLQFTFGHSIWLLSWRFTDKNSLRLPYFFEASYMSGRLWQFSFIDISHLKFAGTDLCLKAGYSCFHEYLPSHHWWRTTGSSPYEVFVLLWCYAEQEGSCLTKIVTIYPSYRQRSVANDTLSQNVLTQLPTYVA